MDTHRHPVENFLGDYCDGKRYREHALFSTDHTALQLMLYYDELEICNPLGFRRQKHKLGICIPNTQCMFYFKYSFVCTGAFYFMLGNISPCFRSKISNIQLLLLAKYSMVVEFGIDRLLEPIVEDIKKLESVGVAYMYVL